jgi:hypothetical protein
VPNPSSLHAAEQLSRARIFSLSCLAELKQTAPGRPGTTKFFLALKVQAQGILSFHRAIQIAALLPSVETVFAISLKCQNRSSVNVISIWIPEIRLFPSHVTKREMDGHF